MLELLKDSTANKKAVFGQWIPVAEQLPNRFNHCYDDVLVIVSGQADENLLMENAIQLAEYYADEERWFLDSFPDWKNPEVTFWMPLPKLPDSLIDDILDKYPDYGLDRLPEFHR